jgi:hypothetical protein
VPLLSDALNAIEYAGLTKHRNTIKLTACIFQWPWWAHVACVPRLRRRLSFFAHASVTVARIGRIISPYTKNIVPVSEGFEASIISSVSSSVEGANRRHASNAINTHAAIYGENEMSKYACAQKVSKNINDYIS